MKNFTKIFMTAMAIAMATNGLLAQNIGIKAGFNLSKINIMDVDEEFEDNIKMKPGFHVGATVEFPINDIFSFETGLLISTKGFNMSEEFSEMGETFKFEYKMNLIYLDIPLLAKASFDVGDVKVFGAVGPYIAVGLSGNYKAEESYESETDSYEDSYKEDIDFGNDLSRVEYGLSFGAGVEINSFQIGLTYGLGLGNISSNDEFYNRVLGLSVGYIFGGN